MGRVTNLEAEKLQACFVVRTESLGEDRYLNRYFACIHPNGHISRVYVEALCDPSPLRLLAQKAAQAATASATTLSCYSSSSNSSSCDAEEETEEGQACTNLAKKQRLCMDIQNSSSSSRGACSSRALLRVFPPSADSVSLLGDCNVSEWPIVRRPIAVESLAAFLQLQQQQQQNVCFFVSPNAAVLQHLRNALSPSLKRERALRHSLVRAIEEVSYIPTRRCYACNRSYCSSSSSSML